MFKRSLMVAAFALGVSLSFNPAFAAVSSLADAQAQASTVEAMPAGAAKDAAIVELVRAAGVFALANKDDAELSKSLGAVTGEAADGLTDKTSAEAEIILALVAAMQAGTPGEVTASVDAPAAEVADSGQVDSDNDFALGRDPASNN